MTTDAWITLVVLVATFGVLAFDRLPAAAAMGAAVGVLLLLDVVDQRQALSGLSSSAPVTIAALYVLAGAATVTGALSPLIDRVLAGRSGPGDDTGDRGAGRRLGRLAVAAGALSAVLPNTPLVALAAPRVVTWCRRAGVSASPYLMPMSYAAVFGGVVTVIGTSTNLVVSDLLVAQGEQPLGVFEITGVGLPVAAIGISVLVVTAPRLLRHRRPAVESDPAAAVQPYTIALAVEPDGPLVGRTIEAAGLRHLHGVFLAGVERAGTVVPARPGTVLGSGDICYFAGDVVDVVDLLEVNGLASAEHAHLVGAGDRPDAGLFEAVVSERSDLAGATLRDAGFRARYDAAVLAIRRHDDDLPGKLGTVVLRPGDVLLVLATPEFERVWRGHGDFSVIASLDAPPPVRRERSSLVIAAIVGLVASVVTGVLDLMEASLLAAVALIALRVISVTEARRAVNLNVVLTIAMSISLGTAVAVSGLAAEMATLLGNLGDPFGDTGRLVAVLAATMVLTELLSNNAAAALMLPVATATAIEAGLDPRSMAIVVLIGASCSFLSPIGYQTNLMVYGLGGYRFRDFTLVGAPLSLVTLIVTPVVVPLALGL
ncbi:MAG: SLC13 family permease [Ilumatobacteraceae bacterium]